MPVVLLADRALVGESIFMDEQVALQVPLVAELVSTHFAEVRLFAKVNGASVRSHGLDVVERLATDITEKLLEVKAGTLMRHQTCVLRESLATLVADVAFYFTETRQTELCIKTVRYAVTNVYYCCTKCGDRHTNMSPN